VSTNDVQLVLGEVWDLDSLRKKRLEPHCGALRNLMETTVWELSGALPRRKDTDIVQT
jgi:hypothetical protein